MIRTSLRTPICPPVRPPVRPLRAVAPVLALPAAVLALWSGPALAGCPAALGAGVVLSFDDGSSAVYTATDEPGVILERLTYLEVSEGYEARLAFGIFPLSEIDFDADGPIAGSAELSVYAQSLIRPEPGQSRQGIMAEVRPDNELPFTRRLDYVSGPLRSVAIGDCDYRGFELELSFIETRLPMRLTLEVIPELDIAFATRIADPEGEESYAATAIEALIPDPAPAAPEGK